MAVQSPGYAARLSTMIGVPSAVTDLNLALTPQAGQGQVFLPLIIK
ncbi:MAG: hypothetical protein U0401_08115 [Anaerolineae bacterium]